MLGDALQGVVMVGHGRFCSWVILRKRQKDPAKLYGPSRNRNRDQPDGFTMWFGRFHMAADKAGFR